MRWLSPTQHPRRLRRVPNLLRTRHAYPPAAHPPWQPCLPALAHHATGAVLPAARARAGQDPQRRKAGQSPPSRGRSAGLMLRRASIAWRSSRAVDSSHYPAGRSKVTHVTSGATSVWRSCSSRHIHTRAATRRGAHCSWSFLL